MMMHALAALVHLIAAVGAGAPMPNPSSDNLSQPVLDHIAGPLLTSAQFLIPSAVAIRDPQDDGSPGEPPGS